MSGEEPTKRQKSWETLRMVSSVDRPHMVVAVRSSEAVNGWIQRVTAGKVFLSWERDGEVEAMEK